MVTIPKTPSPVVPEVRCMSWFVIVFGLTFVYEMKVPFLRDWHYNYVHVPCRLLMSPLSDRFNAL